MACGQLGEIFNAVQGDREVVALEPVAIQVCVTIPTLITAREGKIEIAIVVEVTPGKLTVLNALETDRAVFQQDTRIISVNNPSRYAVDITTGKREVGVAIVVVVSPAHGAVLERSQTLYRTHQVIYAELLFRSLWR